MVGLGADPQLLKGAWDAIKLNFASNGYFWGIIIVLDFVVAAYRYHKTREPAEFIKTFVLMLIISAGIAAIFSYVSGGS